VDLGIAGKVALVTASTRGIGLGIAQALARGVTLTGCTVHLVTEEVDAGPILLQAAVPVLPGDTVETLHARIQVEEHRILPEAIEMLKNRIATARAPLR
jgi:phosphoribosylglycinamide formyltransferase-1